jgi:magnesium transporter
MELLPAPVARSLQSLLRFPENTAGALMDPAGLALPEDLTVREALARIRELPEQTRYDVYVVDREQVLVGVLNLRELLLARPQALLLDVMVREPLRLHAQDDRSVVIGHPGWKRAHALPVVDEKGSYIGVVRYRILRQLEEELLGGRGQDANTSEALGALFAAGAGGLLDALTTASSSGSRGRG